MSFDGSNWVLRLCSQGRCSRAQEELCEGEKKEETVAMMMRAMSAMGNWGQTLQTDT